MGFIWRIFIAAWFDFPPGLSVVSLTAFPEPLLQWQSNRRDAHGHKTTGNIKRRACPLCQLVILSFIWSLTSYCYLRLPCKKRDGLAFVWPVPVQSSWESFLVPSVRYFLLTASEPSFHRLSVCHNFFIFPPYLKIQKVIKQEAEAQWGWRTSLKSHLKFSAEAEERKGPSGPQTHAVFIAYTFIKLLQRHLRIHFQECLEVLLPGEAVPLQLLEEDGWNK